MSDACESEKIKLIGGAFLFGYAVIEHQLGRQAKGDETRAGSVLELVLITVAMFAALLWRKRK